MQDGLKNVSSNINSFLMIGQSNMAGRGHFDEVEPIKNKLCHMLRMGRWQAMSEPINPDRAIFGKGFTSGIGPAPSFADELSKYKKCRVGIIPAADGGTSINEWQKGGILFDNAVFMTKLAMRTSTFSGIIWHQGESDCGSEEKLSEYPEKLVKFVSDIREAIGCGDVPFIAGELSENITESWNVGDRPVKFNKMLRELVGVIPNFAVASSAGLTLKEDGVHFNSVSAREFGRRYFEEYKKLVEGE